MELFKILGTIAIEKADAIRALKETQDEGEKTGSTLGKAFSGIGKGAAVVGKAIMTGLAVGATAVAGLATAAINAYGDYEQLVGGVETLFGTRGAQSVEEYAKIVGKSVKDVEAEFGMLQEAQSAVMENASNAYKTAGLSMNEYMETANGLAAALNQSSASQLESAALADQAIIDMADNAAKMGTSMESIQTAYAGFAKQNYTMLDNLKLGYGGTKEEMQRLLDDAGKIAGKKFDLSSFADVTEAIHVMQVEMGIAGTTAAEASGTIQGSFSMLKGAWSNLMVGLSDPEANLDSLISNVFDSVTTFAGNLIPRITQVLSGIATAFKQLVPMITNEIPNLLGQVLPALVDGAVALIDGLVAAMPGIVSAIMAALPALIDGVLQLITSLATALPQIIQPIVDALPSIIQAIVTALPTLIPALIDGLVQVIVMLCGMIPQIIQPLIDNLHTIIISIIEALLNNLPVLIEGIIQLTMGIVTALPQIIQALVDAIPTIVSLLVEAILTNLPAIIMGLIQVVMGIVVALPQIFGSLIQAVPAALSGIWDAIQNVFAPLGAWFSNVWSSLGNVPGLAQLKTMIEQVWAAIKNHITVVVGAIKDYITTYWEAIKNVISTVVSSIKNVISTAWEAIKTVISNVMKLISSVLKGDWEGVKSAISNIQEAIKSVISSVWNAIKAVISSVLNGIKSVVSSAWNGIKSVVSSSLNTIKSVATSIWNGIKSAISNAVNGIKSTVSKGFNEVKSTITNTIKELPGKVKDVGLDIVKGIGNGITNGVSWIKARIKEFVGDVTSFLKKLFKIESPSKVMRDEVGKYLAEGIAEGINQNTDTVYESMETLANGVMAIAKKNVGEETSKLQAEAVKVAKRQLETHKTYNKTSVAEEAAYWNNVRKLFKEGTEERVEADKEYLEAKAKIDSETLSNAEATLDKYKTYNELTLADEVAFWDNVRKKVAEGTDERLKADKKYLDAKKSLDEKILAEEEKLQKALDDIAQRTADRQKSIADSFSLFDEVTFEEWLLPTQMIDNVENQVQAYEKYQTEIDKLRDRIGSSVLFDELEEMGIKALPNIQSINSMTDEQLSEFVKLYSKKQEISRDLASKAMEKEAFAETYKAYQEFETEMDKLGVEIVKDAEAMETGVENVFVSFRDMIKREGSMIVMGFDDLISKPIAGAIASLENLAIKFGESKLLNFLPSSFSELGAQAPSSYDVTSKPVSGNETFIHSLAAIFEDTMSKYSQKIADAFNVDVCLDTGVLVGELVEPMNEELGRLTFRKDRGL